MLHRDSCLLPHNALSCVGHLISSHRSNHPFCMIRMEEAAQATAALEALSEEGIKLGEPEQKALLAIVTGEAEKAYYVSSSMVTNPPWIVICPPTSDIMPKLFSPRVRDNIMVVAYSVLLCLSSKTMTCSLSCSSGGSSLSLSLSNKQRQQCRWHPFFLH